MRIEKIGFAKFLHVYKIPGFDHSNCFCGVSKQMSKYVIMNCFLMSKKKRNLADSEWRDEKLSPFNDYFQNDEKRWQNDLLKRICCRCFR